MAADYELEGWKSIAAVVGRGVAACKRYADWTVDPLPVRVLLGRVVARPEDVRAWVARQARPLTSDAA